MRLDEINERLSAIKVELDNEDVNVEELETETNGLLEERKAIMENAEKRAALVNAVINLPEAAVTRKFDEKVEERKLENVNIAATPEYRSAYLKNLMGKPLEAEERALITASVAIPTETMNSIIEKLEQTSVLYPYISKSNIPGNLSLPRQNAKNDSAWVAMGTAATDSADSFDAVTLSAYKLIKTIEVGADVSVMSIPAFETFLVNALVKKMSKAVDHAIVNGTGASQPTGLALAGQITNTGTFTKAGMTFGDLVTIISDLPSSEYRRNAKFVMPSALYFNDVIAALATEGIGVDMQNALQYKVLGYDVILDDYMPANTIIFGDLSYYHFNFASDVSVEADKSVAFRTGSTVFRAMALADGKPTLPEAFNLYTRAAV